MAGPRAVKVSIEVSKSYHKSQSLLLQGWRARDIADAIITLADYLGSQSLLLQGWRARRENPLPYGQWDMSQSLLLQGWRARARLHRGRIRLATRVSIPSSSGMAGPRPTDNGDLDVPADGLNPFFFRDGGPARGIRHGNQNHSCIVSIPSSSGMAGPPILAKLDPSEIDATSQSLLLQGWRARMSGTRQWPMRGNWCLNPFFFRDGGPAP